MLRLGRWLTSHKKSNKALIILIATNSLVLFAGAMLAPIYAIFVEEIGGNLLDASFTAGIFALAAALTSIISGRYSDKIKESELIVVGGYIVMGIAFIMLTQVKSIYGLFVIQALMGIAEAAYLPAFDGIFSKNLKRKHESSGWGAWESMMYITTAFGSFVGGLIVSLYGFNLLFIIMGVLCLGSAIYIYFLPRKVL